MDTLYASKHRRLLQIFQKQCRQYYLQSNTPGIQRHWLLGSWLYHQLPGEDALGPLASASRAFAPPLGELRLMRRLYAYFPDWEEAPSALRWSHCRLLLAMRDAAKRTFYMEVCLRESWSSTELTRHVRARYYERYIVPPPVSLPADTDTLAPVAWLKDPLVLEFTQLSKNRNLSEKALEDALMAHLPDFLAELGPGFTFLARQKRLSTSSGRAFYADLACYHRPTRRTVLIELKAGALTHRDIGQMDFYVRLYDAQYRPPGDAHTIGLILCSSKDDSLERYSALREKERLFALRYKLCL